MLGRPVDLRGEIDWHADPVTGHRWHREFYRDVQIYELDAIDVKHVWEVNRHEFLVDLAKGWRLCRDD